MCENQFTVLRVRLTDISHTAPRTAFNISNLSNLLIYLTNKIMKKEQCYFSANNITQIDYKDTEILKKFVNPHARMVASRHTGVCSKHQRQLAQSIKRSRFMALLPFVAR